MTPSRHVEPTPPAGTGLTAEAAHARHILDRAASGPPSTLGLVVGLMQSLIEQGYRTSVTWYLAPSPADDLNEVVFSLRSEEETEDRRWRDRREIAALLSDAQRLTRESRSVEVWSGNGHGLRRLVIASGPGRALQFVPPDPRHYAGDASLAQAAVAAWRVRPPAADGSRPDLAGDAGGVGEAAGAPPSLEPVEGPGVLLTAGGAPAVATPGPDPALSAAALSAALQDALSQVQVEVDLGSMQDMISEALRAAREDHRSALSPSEAEPAPKELTTGEVQAVSLDGVTFRGGVPDVVALPATARRHLVAGDDDAAAQMAVALDLVGARIDRAIDRKLGEQLPLLVDRLSAQLAVSIDATVAGRLPDLMARRAMDASRARPGLERSVPQLDPVDVARRVAASVLSPAEIAETLVFRLRPLLDEHNERALHRESSESDRDRVALEQLRSSLNRLGARLERRLDRLEDEVRHPSGSPGDPGWADPGMPPSASDAEIDSPAAAALRVVRPDDGR